jgi:multiple sugar transport system ATP-binding protein
VALGRAIVRDPKVFLFDEPLSNLDAALRVSTRGEIGRLHRRLGATMIYVTHDQVEAMTLGSRICIMNGGKVVQVGPPLEVYKRPGQHLRGGLPRQSADESAAGPVRKANGPLLVELGQHSLELAAPRYPALTAEARSRWAFVPRTLPRRRTPRRAPDLPASMRRSCRSRRWARRAL